MPARFHNPYTFIPRLPREEVLADPDLGDFGSSASGITDDAPRRELGHGRLLPDRWSGTLRLKIRTETPLLLCDAQHAVAVEGAKPRDHRAYPARVDADGKPYIPATTLKGAISTAYEIITNSRYRVIDEALWGSRLAYRSATDETKDLKPVRIVKDAEGRFRAQILQAARVHMYPKPGNGSWRDIKNGARVWIRLDRGKVCEMVPATGPKPDGMYEGWLLRTGRTMDTKKHERVFYIGQTREEAEIPDDVAEAYNDLLANYHSIHQEELAAGSTGPSAAEHAEWGYHVKELQKLEEGHLCWARTEELRGSINVKELRPVMISRKLYAKAPIDLVPDNLKPARSIEELSPAERLFGWTNQSGHGAVRGRIRIGRAKCLRDDAIEEFMPSGFPLNVLGQPKPQQERFYAASDSFGAPLKKGANRGTGYKDQTGLRGYKVYVHHRGLPDNYWLNPTEDRTGMCVRGWAQEYRRPGKDPSKERDSQNRSILSWVKPGTEFEVDVHLTNLTDFELGALLWLFSMNDAGDSQTGRTPKRYLRIGGGKPLGFGSVSVEVDWDSDASVLMRGESWREHWVYLASSSPANALSIDSAKKKRESFEKRIKGAFKLEEHPERDFLKAFLRTCEGFRPVHYPRVGSATRDVPQNPSGENFEWFVANERQGNRYPLPSPNSDDGLPYLQP